MINSKTNQSNKKNHNRVSGAEFFTKYGIYFILLLLIIIGTFLSPVFLTSRNILNVLRQLSVIGILAYAQMMLIISGNIDLSLGSVVAFSGMVSVTTYLSTGSYLLTFLVAILVATACTFVSGVLVAKIKLPSFVATMAIDLVARGLCYLYTGGQPIYQIGNYGKVSSGFIGRIPIPVIFLLIIALISSVILNKTTLGRNLYAVGGNKDAANSSGINVDRTIIKSYVIAGILTGVAAVLQIARVNSALPDTAMNYHGDAIASTVIGGTSFTGGIGTSSGTFVGSLIMGMINNILNLVGVQSYVQYVVRGLILVGALSIDIQSKNRKVKKKDIKTS